MTDERVNQIEQSALAHLRAAGEPVREAYLYERVRADDLEVTGDEFIAVMMRLEVQGHVHVDMARDELPDPAPFQPRFWRVIE